MIDEEKIIHVNLTKRIESEHAIAHPAKMNTEESHKEN